MLNVQHALFLTNATAGFEIAYKFAGLKPGDEVIAPAITFIATIAYPLSIGANVVLADVDPRTINIDPGDVEKKITAKTKVIIPVHIGGWPVDMAPLMKLARKHNIMVIEDAAQAISATYKGKKAGEIGTCGCFSFFPSKNLGGIGDGGMIVTNNEQLYHQLFIMRNHGMEPKYYHKYIGGNFRLDPIQAAALLVKLPYLNKWSESRRKNAAYYNKKFEGTMVQIPVISDHCVSIYNQYVIRVPRRDEVVKHLQANRIGCEIYYPVPMHLQECFAYLDKKEGNFPESEKAAQEVMALPVYPELTNEMQDCVVDTILDFLAPH